MKGEILTFYSIKMGVGRSMALASIAWILANKGKRVLIVDWDLDNPSLHRFFTTSQSNAGRLDSTPGLIDLCWELMLAARAPQEKPILDADSGIIASILPAHITSLGYGFNACGGLDIMRAGQPGRRFNARVRYFSWSDFYDRLKGAEILNVIFGRMADAYDYVLVDSPGGRINTSLQFPIVRTDKLLLCFTLDDDSLGATARVARFIQSRMGSALRIYPVPMRLENAEKQKLDLRRSKARQLFAPYLAHLPDGSEERYWGEVEIPEIPYYRDEHELPPMVEAADNPNTITASYERLIAYLTDASVTRLVPLKERITTEQTTEAYQKSFPDDEGIDPEAYSGPYEGEGDYSFVSYSRGDVDMVMPIVQDISDLGYHLWWDEGIPGATEWLRHLEEKIRQSKYLLLFLSRRAVESKYVRAEIEFAQQNRKSILAIRLDLTTLPQPIEELLGKYQMLDVSAVAFEENLGKTLRLLDAQTAPSGD
jgi:cellulose biosynthesis protein BcsQ